MNENQFRLLWGEILFQSIWIVKLQCQRLNTQFTILVTLAKGKSTRLYTDSSEGVSINKIAECSQDV
jgi:hypothetical protein